MRLDIWEGRADDTDNDTELRRFISAQIHPYDMFWLMADSFDRQMEINAIKMGYTFGIDKEFRTARETIDDRVIHPDTKWYARIRW